MGARRNCSLDRNNNGQRHVAPLQNNLWCFGLMLGLGFARRGEFDELGLSSLNRPFHLNICKVLRYEPKVPDSELPPIQYKVVKRPYLTHWVTNKADIEIFGLNQTFPIVFWKSL